MAGIYTNVYGNQNLPWESPELTDWLQQQQSIDEMKYPGREEEGMLTNLGGSDRADYLQEQNNLAGQAWYASVSDPSTLSPHQQMQYEAAKWLAGDQTKAEAEQAISSIREEQFASGEAAWDFHQVGPTGDRVEFRPLQGVESFADLGNVGQYGIDNPKKTIGDSLESFMSSPAFALFLAAVNPALSAQVGQAASGALSLAASGAADDGGTFGGGDLLGIVKQYYDAFQNMGTNATNQSPVTVISEEPENATQSDPLFDNTGYGNDPFGGAYSGAIYGDVAQGDVQSLEPSNAQPINSVSPEDQVIANIQDYGQPTTEVTTPVLTVEPPAPVLDEPNINVELDEFVNVDPSVWPYDPNLLVQPEGESDTAGGSGSVVGAIFEQELDGVTLPGDLNPGTASTGGTPGNDEVAEAEAGDAPLGWVHDGGGWWTNAANGGQIPIPGTGHVPMGTVVSNVDVYGDPGVFGDPGLLGGGGISGTTGSGTITGSTSGAAGGPGGPEGSEGDGSLAPLVVGGLVAGGAYGAAGGAAGGSGGTAGGTGGTPGYGNDGAAGGDGTNGAVVPAGTNGTGTSGTGTTGTGTGVDTGSGPGPGSGDGIDLPNIDTTNGMLGGGWQNSPTQYPGYTSINMPPAARLAQLRSYMAALQQRRG